MNDKTKAVLHITAPTGQEFVDKGAIVNQTKGLNGVCIELYIPTKSIQNPIDTDSLEYLIAQEEADKKAYPLTWFYGWEFKNYSGEKWIRYGVGNIGWFDGRNVRRHPHANLIMQSEQDKIHYPDFYGQLWQFKFDDDNVWETGSCSFKDAENYRQHPHRENIIKFHACSDDDKKRWQILDQVRGWITPCSQSGFPNWHEDCEYRLRPKMCFITLQDGTRMEYPEPVREALKFGDMYWCVFMNSVVESGWQNNNENCHKALNAGAIHLTEEAAKQHLSALQAINAQIVI